MTTFNGTDVPVKISIVIRTLNEAAHLPQLLAGISKQSLVAHEVILVDSGSTDGSIELALEAGLKVVKIKKSQFSFGRALNMGCAAASGDILLFASGHVYPERSDWLQKMAAPFKDPDVALVYGRQRGGVLNKFSEHRLFQRWFPNVSTSQQRHYFCNNANCAVRRTLWETQPYDEDLTGLEDLAWAKEIQKKKHKVAYQHEASIIHVHDETWAQVRNRYRRESFALQMIEPEQSKSWFYFLHLAGATIAMDCVAAISQRKLNLIPEIFLFRINQYFGAWQGTRLDTAPAKEVLDTFYYPTYVAPRHPDPVSHAPERLNYRK